MAAEQNLFCHYLLIGPVIFSLNGIGYEYQEYMRTCIAYAKFYLSLCMRPQQFFNNSIILLLHYSKSTKDEEIYDNYKFEVQLFYLHVLYINPDYCKMVKVEWLRTFQSPLKTCSVRFKQAEVICTRGLQNELIIMV